MTEEDIVNYLEDTGYPAHIVAATADSLAENREHCPVCRSLAS